MRNLVIVLPDQLNEDSAALEGFDPERDAVWTVEPAAEWRELWAHRRSIAFRLSAQRHFCKKLRDTGWPVNCRPLLETAPAPRDAPPFRLPGRLAADLDDLRPERLVTVRPGDWNLLAAIRRVAESHSIPLELRRDRHFYCDTEEFAEFAAGKRSLLLERFYRRMRRKHGVLLEDNGEPSGGRWNFDSENRLSFDRSGPGEIPAPPSFPPDDITRSVLDQVADRFSGHPGGLEGFSLPVTRLQALEALQRFVRDRLPGFGPYQDAMWTGRPFLYHSLLSAPLNLKLLSPAECVDAAVAAFYRGDAPLAGVEAFVRQILGWREYVRGIYWHFMPEYEQRNSLEHELDPPAFFWDGRTGMRCVREAMGHVLEHAYSHHIQRLMVLGLFAQLYGVHPLAFHHWHMAMYADAHDWVSLPNALGMSQYGDGGLMGSKPYCASGNYIRRMSNYCGHCPYDHRNAVGGTACPFTTLYWDFLDRHEARFRNNPRMNLQLKNLEKRRSDSGHMAAIRRRAEEIRSKADL